MERKVWDPRDGLRLVEPPEEFLDLRNLMQVAWPAIGWDPPSRGQLLLADDIQRQLTDPAGGIDMVVEGWRGLGKSADLGLTICWVWLWDVRQKVLVLSGTETKAAELAFFVRQLLDQVPVLNHLRPSRGRRDRVEGFDVAGAPVDQSKSLRIASIMGTVVGGRADLIVPDDIEVPNTAETVHMRERLWRRYGELNALLRPEGMRKKLILGTPQAEETMYDRIVQERGGKMTLLPIRYPDPQLLEYYGDRLNPVIRAELAADPTLEGRAVDPDRFPDHMVAEIEATTDPGYFKQQYLLDSRMLDEDLRPLRLRDLVVIEGSPTHANERYVWAGDPDLWWDEEVPCVGLHKDRYHRPMHVAGEVVPYDEIVMAVDPSGSGRDETGYVVLGVLNGYVHLLDTGGFIDGQGPETLRALSERAEDFSVDRVIVEDNFGDGIYGTLLEGALRKHVTKPIRVDGEKARGQKVNRILEALVPLVRSHRMIWHAEAIRRDFRRVPMGVQEDKRMAYRMAYQFSRLTRVDRTGGLVHDDRLEALALGVKALERHVLPDVGGPEAERDEFLEWQRRCRLGLGIEKRQTTVGRVERHWNRGQGVPGRGRRRRGPFYSGPM
jgi:hypothetical protein